MGKQAYLSTIIIFIICQVNSLHLTIHPIHLQTSTDLILKLQNIITSLNTLNSTAAKSISNLNPTNQTQRIYSLEQAIIFTRNQLFKIYIDSIINLNSTTYYCFPPSSSQKLGIKNSLNAFNNNLQFLSQIPPINESTNSLHSFPENALQLSNLIGEDMSEGGLATSTMPIKTNQVNLIASNLSLGNESLSNLSKVYQSNASCFSSVCPLETPFIDSQGTCIYCQNYYDLASKSCITCNSYDVLKRNCLDNIPSTITISSIKITNINNLTGILLPNNMTLDVYKDSLQKNIQNANLIPCPQASPFFDGTTCISCPSSQYFSAQTQSCQTCPSLQIYNNATYHCDQLNYYSNLNNPKWISIGSPPETIKTSIKNKSVLTDWIPCPQNSPFFNGQNCVSCSDPTPLFSYDSLNCTACIGSTIFNANIQSCVNSIHKQTNPSSPNLILEGRPLNEWKYYYYNNITADTQLEDCPSTNPYFDGLTCISCPNETPYFNLQYRYCQVCNPGTAYDASVSECLSTSGNIVSQSPTLTKMAASIFA